MSREAASAIIVAGARTPFVRAFGPASETPVKVLAARAMREAVDRAGIAPELVDAVVLGNVAGPADAPNVARVAALLAGIPERAPALSVNRNCASGLEAIAQAARMIEAGEAEIVVAGGAESMSLIPFLFGDEARRAFLAARRARTPLARMARLARLRPRHLAPRHGLEIGLRDPACDLSMGETAEILAAEFGITREEQDFFALESHQRATAAAEKLAEEIAPLPAFEARGGAGALLLADVGPRPGQSLEALAKLRPAFDNKAGTITAGNASPITDGAAALVLASPGAAARTAPARGPLGRMVAAAVAGLSPRRMGLGPAHVIPRLLGMAGWTLDDVDLFEINEAFAAQVIACERALASEEFCRKELGLPGAVGAIARDRLNVNGGAIALGHPVGASGARLALTLLYEMRRRGARRGLVSLCVGGGQGMGALLEAA